MEQSTFALIADIHGNVWALDAVLADIRRHICSAVLAERPCTHRETGRLSKEERAHCYTLDQSAFSRTLNCYSG